MIMTSRTSPLYPFQPLPPAAVTSDLELAAKLQQAAEAAEDESVNPVDWSTTFRPGSMVAGAVHEVQPHGLLLDLDDHPDVVGHVAEGQGVAGGKLTGGLKEALTVGQRLTARVLDVSKTAGIVELSLAPEVLAGGKAKAPKLKVRPGD
jgi:predicted RNA-binding protein with RPS1 domain